MSFDLDTYLKTRKELVDALLETALPPAAQTPAILHQAMRHAVLTGGKRLRAILCLAGAEAISGDHTPACAPAIAVELLHAYTLVHDDLPCMDNDLLRRGQPTVHAKYGEDIAVLSGDALQALAFQVLAQAEQPAAALRLQLVAELAQAAGPAGVIAGQVEDLRQADQPTRAIIEYIFTHKTADLFVAAVRMGVIAAGGDQHSLAQLTLYARHLGFAFQIVDDLLDGDSALNTEDPELSCLKIMTAAEARAWAAEHTTNALTALQPLGDNASALVQLAQHLLTRIV